MEETFCPSPWTRNAHLQTIFASLRLRQLGKNPMRLAAQEMIVPAGEGVRLLGYQSRQPCRPARGQAILLHGWEGSADSAYVLSAGRFLFARGFDIFRLNLRDHGPSHHLNRELFHGAMTEETAAAIAFVCNLSEGPSALIGFSLGGNFSLRMALRHSLHPFSGLTRVFAISPTLDPQKSTALIDQGLPLYRHYFLAKWKRSLRRKQRLFPDLYRFDNLMHHDRCLALTEAILFYFQEFTSLEDYFGRYTLSGEDLTRVGLPTTIIAAQDDPFISQEDLSTLRETGNLRLSLQTYGGHCGFLDPFPLGCWYERMIARALAGD